MTDKLEIRIINLTKIQELAKEEDELLDWLFFLINPKCERVEEKMKKSKPLKNAYNKLSEMSNDEQMEQIAWWRYKAILEENTARNKHKIYTLILHSRDIFVKYLEQTENL